MPHNSCYQIELFSLDNPKETKLLSDILYHCTLINGEKGKNLEINYFYFANHGTKEQLEKAEKELREFYQTQQKVAHKLERILEKSPEIQELRENFSFLGNIYSLEIKRKAA